MNNKNNAFADKEPSLFIVQTPFQAMCAINAIRQLHIEDYKLSLHLHKATENRNKQTVEIVERYGLKYHVEDLNPINIKDRLRLLLERKGKYNRVFLGTHLYQEGYFYALKELKNNGNLVLLDDGVATLKMLRNGYKATGRSMVYMAFYKAIAFARGVKLNNIMTVYKNIAPPQWNILINEISLMRQTGFSTEKKDVYFIGTNNSGYIKEGVSESDFKQAIYNVLKEVRNTYSMERITYIPHGRDKSTFAKDYCDELGIIYKPLDVNVEIFILSQGYVPKAIYGFTSSALYNLKMAFPESKINNIILKVITENRPSIFEVTDYYERQGIQTIKA